MDEEHQQARAHGGRTEEAHYTPNPHFNTGKNTRSFKKKRNLENIKRAAEGAQVRVLRGLCGAAAV